jgi:hypothetical protein
MQIMDYVPEILVKNIKKDLIDLTGLLHKKLAYYGMSQRYYLKILSSQKRGGSRGVPFEPFGLPTPSLMFFFNT